MDVDRDDYRPRQGFVADWQRQDPSFGWNLKSIKILIVFTNMSRVRPVPWPPESVIDVRPAADNLGRIIQPSEKVVAIKIKNLPFTVGRQTIGKYDLQSHSGIRIRRHL